MRQRVAVAPLPGASGAVMRRQGVAPSAAASARRRAGVSAMSSTSPIARARLADFKPSSSAHRASVLRPGSTIRKLLGSSPRCSRPGPYRSPVSLRHRAGQHHRMRGGRWPGLVWTCFMRRAARRSVKASAVARAPAVTAAGLISWRDWGSSPAGAKRASRAAAPRLQGSGEGPPARISAWPSRVRIRALRPSRSTSRGVSVAAADDKKGRTSRD